MTKLIDLINAPQGKQILMEIFENGRKVAEQDISEITCQQLKTIMKFQESQDRSYTYKTILYPYAKFIGLQKDVKNKPPVPLYNITGGSMHGSTVSIKTLLRMGIEIPLPEKPLNKVPH